MTNHNNRSPIDRLSLCVSADDAAFMGGLLNPATEQIISLQTTDCDQPIDAHLDGVTWTRDHRARIRIRYGNNR